MKLLFENHRIHTFATGGSMSGGAERQQWLLAKAMASCGHDVAVYSRCVDAREDCELEGVRFRSIKPVSVRAAWKKILQAEHPDWWYFRCADHTLGLLVPLAHSFGTRVAFACAHQNDCTPRKALTRRRYLWPFYAYGLRTVDRILVQHEGQGTLLSPRLREKAFLVNSISDVVPTSGERGGYVAWVAVPRRPKRPELLVAVARRLPGIRFVVCGAPPDSRTDSNYSRWIRAELRSCSNIDYRGKVPPSEAQKVIRSSSLLLSTANAEGFPNTFLQAWGGGVPVISLGLDPGGVIEACNTGILTESVEETAVSIVRLLEDADLNRTLGENGKRYVKTTHGENVVVQQLTQALRNKE